MLYNVLLRIGLLGNYDNLRMTFEVFLLPNHCSVGACGTYHANDDTWVLSQEIIDEPHPMIGAHELVITGYDDDAIAIDKDGKKHQGLFILRNSWGEDVGDRGNYYISYDYFKQFVFGIYEIIHINENENKAKI